MQPHSRELRTILEFWTFWVLAACGTVASVPQLRAHLLPEQFDRDGERTLIDELRCGSPRAADSFVRANVGWMMTVARRYMKDRALAEDCVQDAFLSAFKNIDRFEGRSSLKSWLHQIVVNVALMKFRTLRRHDPRSIDDLLPALDAYGLRLEAPWHQIATPAEILEREDMRRLVVKKIDELPDDYRIVLLLRDIEELSTNEVAELLGLTEGNVKVRLHRARTALKKLVEPLLRGEFGS